jgi:hypothetical protein
VEEKRGGEPQGEAHSLDRLPPAPQPGPPAEAPSASRLTGNVPAAPRFHTACSVGEGDAASSRDGREGEAPK